MQNHILIFFNSFAVFFGVCNLILIAILLYKHKNRDMQKLLAFFICFLGYGIMMLIEYYSIHIIYNNFVFRLFYALLTAFLIFMYGEWADYLITFKQKNRELCRKCMFAVCGICAVLFTIDSMVFMNRGLNPRNKLGDQACTIVEYVAIAIMICFCVRVLYKEKTGLYEICQTLILLVYSVIVALSDVYISFFGYSIEVYMQNVWVEGDWLVTILFCFITNVMGLVFLAGRCFKLVQSALNGQKKDEAFRYSLEEAKETFHITKREMDVLVLVCEGESNNEIAEELCISLNTVKKHINSILKKTGAASRATLISRVRPKAD